MFKVEKRVKLDNETDSYILKIFSLLDKYFVIVDNKYRVYIYDNELKKITKTAILVANTKKFEFFRGIDFVNDNITLASNGNVIVFDVLPRFAKKVVLDMHDSIIDIVKYSNTKKYFVSTAHSGGVILYTTKGYQPIFYMPKRKDFAYSLNFSNDDRFLLLNFYDKESVIFDILTYQIYDTFHTDELIELCVFFNENSSMFFITREGDSYIYSMVTKEITKSEKFPIQLIGSYEFIDNRYLLFCDREDRRLFLFDVSKQEILIDRIYDSVISCIYATQKYIFIGGCNYFDIIDRDSKLEQAQIHLMVKDYRKASFCAKTNMFLNLNREYKDAMEIGWGESLPLLIDNLNKKNNVEAHNIASSFGKLSELETYMTRQFIFGKFNLAISTGNIKNSYDIIENNQFLRETNEYKELEKYWLKMFLIAKKLIANKELSKINTLLRPFIDINGKRELIQNMIKYPNLISKAETLSMTRDYKGFFELLEAHSFLKETDSYKRVLASGLTLYEKFNKFFEEFDLTKCQKVSETLIHFKEYKTEVEDKLYFLSVVEKIKTLGKEKNYKAIFDILNNDRSFFYNEHTQFFIQELNEVFDSLLEHIRKGEPKAIKNKLSNFMNIDVFSYKIEFIIKLAYINEIKKAINTDKNAVNLSKTIARFLTLFGADQMLLYILEKANIKIKVPTNIANVENVLKARVKNASYVDTILILN